MCLIDKKQFRIAEKDIPVFKVVLEKKFSPIRLTKLFRVNYISNTVEYRGYSSGVMYCPENNGYKFDLNFYHALLTKEKAKEFIENLSKNFFYKDKEFSIVIGYIPEGTRYAIEESCGYICARKMILNL